MKPQFPLLAPLLSFVLLALAAPAASADIYKCTGGDGHVTYSNVPTKDCKRLLLDPVGAAPAPKAATKTPTPTTFPRVDDNAQKARDNDRRRILESELAAEQKNLEQARGELAQQESVRSGDERNYQRVLDRLQPFKDKAALHERNIEAIRKEISNLR